MSATTTPIVTTQPSMPAADPAIFKILDDGTVLYKTYQQAANAKQHKTVGQTGDTKKLSQVKYGEKYLTKDGQIEPYTLGKLIEFQLTGLIVVLVVLVGLSLICSLIGRMIKVLDRSTAELPVVLSPVAAPSPSVAAASVIHPGLTDQQLVVLLTAAASEVIGSPVRISTSRPALHKGENWSVQGRSELQTHRLK
jgi:hypothetical protein